MQLVIHLLLFALFFANFFGQALGLDLSLAPGLSVKNAILYLITGVVALEIAVGGRHRLELLSVIMPFALYVAYAVLSWLMVLLVLQRPEYSPRATLISLKGGPIEDLLVLLVYFYGVLDGKRALALLRGILWLVVFGNAVTIIDVLNMPDLGLIQERSDGRVAGPVGQSNIFGAFLACFLPAIVALFWTARGFGRILAAVGAILSGLAFLMALSRGAIVGLLLGALAGAFYLRTLTPAQTMVKAGFGAALLLVAAMASFLLLGYGDLLLERFGVLASDRVQASSGRTAIWGVALRSMLEHPLSFITGFGWHAYETDDRFYAATHNQYLNILFNLGAIGIVLFLLVAANVLRGVRRAIAASSAETRPFMFAFVFGFLGFLGSLVFGEAGAVWLYVWAFAGLSLRIAVSQHREPVGGTARTGRAVAVDGVPQRAYR